MFNCCFKFCICKLIVGWEINRLLVVCLKLFLVAIVLRMCNWFRVKGSLDILLKEKEI